MPRVVGYKPLAPAPPPVVAAPAPPTPPGVVAEPVPLVAELVPVRVPVPVPAEPVPVPLMRDPVPAPPVPEPGEPVPALPDAVPPDIAPAPLDIVPAPLDILPVPVALEGDAPPAAPDIAPPPVAAAPDPVPDIEEPESIAVPAEGDGEGDASVDDVAVVVALVPLPVVSCAVLSWHPAGIQRQHDNAAKIKRCFIQTVFLKAKYRRYAGLVVPAGRGFVTACAGKIVTYKESFCPCQNRNRWSPATCLTFWLPPPNHGVRYFRERSMFAKNRSK